MTSSPISAFFSGIRIRHADNAYIFVPAVLVGLLVTASVAWSGADTAILVGLVLVQLIVSATGFHLYRMMKRDLEDQQRKTQALFSLHSALSFRRPLPYMSSWAATPELALKIHELIAIGRPSTIVELGSGISTLICGYTIQKEGLKARTISYDHDLDYAELTRRHLQDHGLADVCQVLDAPLAEQQLNGGTITWYDLSAHHLPTDIDLLIVDGPPFIHGKHPRHPALPILIDKLSERAVVVLHDTHRREESQTVQRWVRQFPEFKAQTFDTEKGITVLRRGA